MTAPSPRTPWYAGGLRFACTRCGNCCSGLPGYVWVSPQEIRAIAAFLKIPCGQFLQQHTRRISLRRSLLELDDGDCEFLVRDPSGKTGCRIHTVRPLQCRTWPFWKSNLKSEKTWSRASRDCPGIGRGRLHPLPLIQEARRANDEASLPL